MKLMPFAAPAALSLLLLAPAVAAPTPVAPAAALPPAVEQTARAQITRGALEGAIRFLADDALEGRGPGTRGDTLARVYLATELQQLGFQPAGLNGGWEQPFDIVGVKSEAPPVWTFKGKAGGEPGAVQLKPSEDFVVGSGTPAEAAAIDDAEVVFAGYGIEAPEYQWDDFKGADLRGKVLVMLNNDPDWDPKLFAGKTRLYYGRWTYKFESAARHGAAGVVIVHTTPSAGYPWRVVQASWGGEQFQLPGGDEANVTPAPIQGWVSEAAARRLAAAAGHDLDKLIASARSRSFKPVPLGLRTSLRLTSKVSHARTANVAGLLPGGDARLKDEVVVFTAHHDHLGVGAPDPKGDRIYNGAEDNASGCAQVLAIARAIAALPERPRRSVLVLFVAAEEQGLLGSRYYALHPTFAPGRIAANINYDGGNFRGRTRDLTFIGLGKSSLDGLARGVLARQGRTLMADQFPDRGFYYRSDQFSFAKIGVPALHFDGGTDYIGRPAGWGRKQKEAWEEHVYHQPSDQIDATWTFDGMIEDAQAGFYVGWLVAQADAAPAWNPGDEFEATRKKAVEEAASR